MVVIEIDYNPREDFEYWSRHFIKTLPDYYLSLKLRNTQDRIKILLNKSHVILYYFLYNKFHSVK